jgi:DNA-binding HxlR family transcriptional regulator
MEIKRYADEIAFIKGSKYREIIMYEIGNNFKMPKEISKSKNIHLSEVSRALKGLKEKEIVEVINPNAKKSRIYQLTPKGKELLKILNFK